MHSQGIPYTQPSGAPQAKLFFACAAVRCISGGALAASDGLFAVNAR
jgi:hypothetical protein